MHLSTSRQKYGDFNIDRSKQINTLLIFNENVYEIIPNVQYRVDFLSNGQHLSLVIFLPPAFPKDKPTIQVDPASVSHPWIRDDGTIVGAPGLVSYGNHSDLGRVVQAIKRELEKNPPVFKQPVNQSQVNHVSRASGSFMPPNDGPKLPSKVPQIGAQESDSSIPELEHLTIDQLKELDGSPEALIHFIRERNSFASLDQTLSDLRQQIHDSISERQRLCDTIESRRASVLHDLDVYNGLRQRVQTSVDAVKEHRERFSVGNLCDLMQKSSLDDDEASDKCAEQFLEGRLPVDAFLEKYLEVRSAHHKKKSAADRFRRRNYF